MVKCVGNKANVMDDKGHVMEDNLKKEVAKITDQKKKEMVEKIIEDCKDKGSGPLAYAEGSRTGKGLPPRMHSHYQPAV
uniref:Uncharacterized protein n=1 Tax=Timema cristinae TaxID=61476 RepID=A0A7R9DFG8_TIMCR|nr:unnamed protein product [Timema cristinae]